MSPFFDPFLNTWVHVGAFRTRGVFLNLILGMLEVVLGTKPSFFRMKSLVSSSDDSSWGSDGPKCRGLDITVLRGGVEDASGGSKIDFTLFSDKMESTAALSSEVSISR